MIRRMKNLIFVVAFFSLLVTACSSGATATVSATEPVLEAETLAPTATAQPAPTSAPAQPESAPVDVPQLPLVDDFEFEALPNGMAGTLQVGFLTWSDGSAVSIELIDVDETNELALPEQSGNNQILQLNTDIGPNGWAGFSHAFHDESLTTWLPQDWSPYEGIALWLYGNNTGGTLFIDVLDNRNPDPAGDDAERFTYNIRDDFSGWQYFEIPFTEFYRKDIGNGAPNDGFTLTEVHGYAVGAFGSISMGQQTNYLDQVQLYGDAAARPVEVRFAEESFSAKETGVVTIRLNLNKPAAETVTVQYYTIEGTAMPGRDFLLPGDTVTFEPGEMSQSFKVEMIDDAIPEGIEQTLLVLYNPSGAILNPQARAVLIIRDDEVVDANLLLDFNQPPPFITSPGLTVYPLELAVDSEMALPDQLDYENVLAIETANAQTPEFSRLYGSSQDWSANRGLSFWFYGSNSGEQITFELFDNHSTTTADAAPEDWELVWSAEFDDPAGTRPDPNIWQPEIGDGFLNNILGWGNAELEYYTDKPDNAATDGQGNLVITAREIEPGSSNLLCWYGPCEYTSARLITRDRFELTYGRVEARIKLPTGQGLWSAFWLLGANLDEVGWPQSGEIDILENLGREPTTIYGSLHGPGYSGSQNVGSPYELESGTVFDDFHTFAVEWRPDEIRWFIDEVNYFTATPDLLPEGSEWVYDHPFFIILNLAVGGNWPGSPNETTVFPQLMMVDYVRVYGVPNASERFEFSFVDDFEGWQLIEIPFEALTRSANQPEAAPQDGLGLTEVWGYRFRLPANTSGTFYLDKLQLKTD